MDIENIKNEYVNFQSQNPGFGNLLILNKEGEILFSLQENFATPTETKELMDAWLNHKPAVELNEARYPILKWDELQFAAKNVSGKGSLIGCITKSKKFCIVHIDPNTKANLIASTVALNRFSWNLI